MSRNRRTRSRNHGVTSRKHPVTARKRWVGPGNRPARVRKRRTRVRNRRTISSNHPAAAEKKDAALFECAASFSLLLSDGIGTCIRFRLDQHRTHNYAVFIRIGAGVVVLAGNQCQPRLIFVLEGRSISR